MVSPFAKLKEPFQCFLDKVNQKCNRNIKEKKTTWDSECIDLKSSIEVFLEEFEISIKIRINFPEKALGEIRSPNHSNNLSAHEILFIKKKKNKKNNLKEVENLLEKDNNISIPTNISFTKSSKKFQEFAMLRKQNNQLEPEDEYAETKNRQGEFQQSSIFQKENKNSQTQLIMNSTFNNWNWNNSEYRDSNLKGLYQLNSLDTKEYKAKIEIHPTYIISENKDANGINLMPNINQNIYLKRQSKIILLNNSSHETKNYEFDETKKDLNVNNQSLNDIDEKSTITDKNNSNYHSHTFKRINTGIEYKRKNKSIYIYNKNKNFETKKFHKNNPTGCLTFYNSNPSNIISNTRHESIKK